MGSKACSKELKEYFEKCGFKVLDVNCDGGICGRVNIIDKDGYKYFVSARRVEVNIMRKHHLHAFGKSNPHTTENIRLWIEINNKPYSFCGGEYSGSGKKNLFFQCNKCHEIWDAQWLVIETGVGCPYCDGKRVGESNCLGNLRPDLALEWDYKKNYPLTPSDVSRGSRKHIWWLCSACGCSWEAPPCNRTGNCPKRSTNCPRCRKSSGEILIERFLKNKNIVYFSPKKFDGCKYKQNLSFDFFVPEYNCCIEYQGEQHYYPVNFGSMRSSLCQERYDKQVIKDNIKLSYCTINNIDLLIIPYWDFPNIENILANKFNSQ